MAEGRQPLIVYHIENVGTLNFVEEQNVTNISNSTVGSLAIRANMGDQRDESFGGNNEGGRLESDDMMGSQARKNYGQKEPGKEDVTWFQSGKFGMYCQKPLQKGARVYRGKQKLTQKEWKDVAIKLIPFQEKHLKEIDFLTKLQHPNVVRIIASGVDKRFGHWIYIVMELCSQNLQKFFDENKHQPVNFGKSLSFAKQLVSGLAFLHRNKIIHHDLKPDNVLVSMCNEVVMLSNFGLSKEIQDSRSIATVTTEGVGSEGYKAPEIYQTGYKVTPRLDIFPLGLIFHLLFTNGKHPFGSDPYDWRDNIRRNQNLDLSQIPDFEEPNTEKKAQLTDLLEQVLQYKPRDRPTADEVMSHIFFENRKHFL